MSVKKIILLGFVVGTLLFIWSIADAAIINGNTAIVEKGDSLSSIAEQVYGDVDKWTIIRDLNSLVKPYVIHPNQELIVSELEKSERLRIAREVVFDYASYYFKARRGRTFPVTMTLAEAWLEMRGGYDLPSYQVREATQRLNAKLEWVDILDMMDGIVSNVNNYQHVLLMGALMAQESGFRNVVGKHGEIGPCQIKPATAVWLVAGDMPFRTTDEAEYILQYPKNNVVMAYKCLLKLGLTTDPDSFLRTLMKYNAGSERVQYSRQIWKRYKRLLARYHQSAAASR